jgi:S-adenosylmethionine uptake transporter
LLALAAIVFIVTRDLSTRRMSPGTPAMAVIFMTSLVLTGASGFAAAATDWEPIGPRHLAVLTIAAVMLLIGYVTGFFAMRSGEIGFVQPFRYSLLLWSILLGIVMFGEWPDAWMLTGSAIVVATGLFTFYRERSLARMPRGQAKTA